MKGSYALAAVALLASAGAVTAQDGSSQAPPSSPDRANSPVSHSDSRSSDSPTTEAFARQAALDGLTEVELGKLAQQRSTNDEVRQFAAHMIKDHGAANTELKVAATKARVVVPSTLDDEHAKLVKEMREMNPEQFDAAYGEHMREAHKDAVALFESASQSAQVAIPVREFAQATLPTLREHWKEAQGLDREMDSTR